jgi:diguanylate cyclase (GGDEF)-like protein/PAS domain S-box-containing protein
LAALEGVRLAGQGAALFMDSSNRGPARGASILVVDDNELNRDALSCLLRLHQYEVEVADCGDAALARLEARSFDLVLLDVEMADLGGLDVLTKIRATRTHTELPVIMVTARTQGPDIVEAFRLGANDYLTKPIDCPVALARIGTHLSHKRVVEKLRESEDRYALAVNGANDGLWDWNLDTNEVYWSPRWKGMLGYDDSEIGTSPDEWLDRLHQDDWTRVRQAVAAHIAHGTGHFESEHRLRHRNGSFRWVLCRAAAIRSGTGHATRFAGSLTDITSAKLADTLTGLPNRVLFLDLLERAISRTTRRPDYRFALVILGLDRFKTLTNSLGLSLADQLLVEVAHRLQTFLRATDAVSRGGHGFTLARLGGDEFTVLLDDVDEASDAVRIAERLREALQRPFDLDGQQVFVTASAGITLSSSGYSDPEGVLRDAAIALHRAKAGSATRCELFDVGMRDRAVSRLRVETDMRQAIERGAFEVFYQPIIAVRGGRLAAFEALVRWRHPTQGLIDPADFIPIAEDTEMIVLIGRQVLSQSCHQMMAWQRRFGAMAPRVMCVNVSSKQFADTDLTGEIESVLAESGLDPASLKLEITESAFLGDIRSAQVTLGQLRTLGVAWSLDDFGTGYSSLSYLHRLHVDTVKVDRSFVSRIGFDDGSEMVRAIAAIAHNMGMDVVAEGVETAEQLEWLRAIGCEYAQGFYFSRPVDVSTATDLIAASPWRNDALFLTGHAVQLHMWPSDSQPLRVS